MVPSINQNGVSEEFSRAGLILIVVSGESFIVYIHLGNATFTYRQYQSHFFTIFWQGA